MIKSTTERKAGIALSFLSIIVSFVIGFAVTPVIIKKLGDSEYGVYTLVASLCAYLNIIEQGLADTVVKYIIKFKIENDRDKIEHFSAVILLINGLISLAIVIAGVILYNAIPQIYQNSMSALEIQTAKRLLVLMIINLIVSFISNLYQGVLTASEKFIILRVTEIANLIISNAATVAVLFMGGRSFSVVIVILACNSAFALFKFLYCKLKLRHRSKLHKNAITKGVYLELLKYFLAVLIVVVVEQIYWKLDNIIISIMLGATFVTVYSIGMSFHKYLMKFATTISKVMTPKVFKEVLSGKDPELVTNELIRISRMQAFGVYLALCGLAVYGSDFIRLWVGAQYGEAYAIILITLIPYSFEIVGNIRNVILQAHDLYMKKSLITLAVSILNAVMTVIMVKLFGIVGAAACTGAGVLIGQVGINWLLVKHRCCDLKRFYLKVYAKLSIVAAIMIAVGFASKLLIKISTWTGFFITAAVFAAVYVVLIWFIVLDADEKKSVLRVIKKKTSNKENKQ